MSFLKAMKNWLKEVSFALTGNYRKPFKLPVRDYHGTAIRRQQAHEKDLAEND